MLESEKRYSEANIYLRLLLKTPFTPGLSSENNLQ